MEIHCHCGRETNLAVPETYSLDGDTNLLNQILSGDFMKITCEGCKNELKIEYACSLVWQEKKLTIAFFPETDKDSFLVDVLKAPTGCNRVVFGYKELVEKLKVYSEGLDDHVLETLKLSFLKAQKNSDLKMYYSRQENGKLHFYLEGLKESEVGVTSAPYTAYVSLLEKKKAEPDNDFWKDLASMVYVNAQQLG